MTRQEMMETLTENGIEFKKNASNADLEQMVADLEKESVEVEETEAEVDEVAKLAEEVEKRNAALTADKKAEEEKAVKNKPAKLGNAKAEARRQASKLVRCIVTAMDKDKSEIPGEIISVGNRMTGTIKKYIPFGKEWHIPQIIVDVLKEKKTWTTRDVKTAHGMTKKDIEIPAYNVSILDDLTQEELDRITKENK